MTSTNSSRHRALHRSTGLILLLHGFAHALPVFLVTGAAMVAAGAAGALARIVTGLAAALATAGFVAAGFGALGVSPFRAAWPRLVWIAAAASLVLAVLSPESFWLPGLAITAFALLVAEDARTRATARLDADDTVVATATGVEIDLTERSVRRGRGVRGAARALGRIAATGVVAFILVFLGMRPWFGRWGATDAELRLTMPLDPSPRELLAETHRAITVPAPPTQVWPWLAQIGQDRGGFYSYDWLENLFGAHIHNADRVHPEWQSLDEGGFVRTVSPDYLSGRLGDRIGWRVLAAERGRHFVLENWGAFVLVPQGETTRLVVRTRTGRPSLLTAPLMLLAFEPAHFIMERGMLRGIRARVERAS